VPTRALAVSGVIAAVILVLGMVFQNAVATIVSFAVIGIYAAFQMIVAGALFARLRGWRPAGHFQLGRWGLVVNAAGLVWGLGAIVNMVWPRSPDQPWFLNYAMGLTALVVVGVGALYMVVLRPYDHGDSPAGDAGQ
jgi:amino acid transporter